MLADLNERPGGGSRQSVRRRRWRTSAPRYRADVADEARRRRPWRAAPEEAFGPLTVWVNNAGVSRPAMLHRMDAGGLRSCAPGARDAARSSASASCRPADDRIRYAGVDRERHVLGGPAGHHRADQLLGGQGRDHVHDQVRRQGTGPVRHPGQCRRAGSGHADDRRSCGPTRSSVPGSSRRSRSAGSPTPTRSRRPSSYLASPCGRLYDGPGRVRRRRPLHGELTRGAGPGAAELEFRERLAAGSAAVSPPDGLRDYGRRRRSSDLRARPPLAAAAAYEAGFAGLSWPRPTGRGAIDRRARDLRRGRWPALRCPASSAS